MGSARGMFMTNREFRITHSNHSFTELAKTHSHNIRAYWPEFDAENLHGLSAELFRARHGSMPGPASTTGYPYDAVLQMGDAAMAVRVNSVLGGDGDIEGYVFGWEDVTVARKTSAILHALEEAQLRADFGADGSLKTANAAFSSVFGIARPDTSDHRLIDVVCNEDGQTLILETRDAHAVIGQFRVELNGTARVLDGSLSPISNADGQVIGHVLLGRDVTDAKEQLAEAAANSARMVEEQRKVVDALRLALKSLSDGDLSTRITSELSGEYRVIQTDFNNAIESLDTAVVGIIESAKTIMGESGNISSAADDLSRRTEQQASTLEQTAAAISELTASVASAAERAKQANDVVHTARENA